MPTFTSQAQEIQKYLNAKTNLVNMRQIVLTESHTAYRKGELSEQEYKTTLKDMWSFPMLCRRIAKWLSPTIATMSFYNVLENLLFNGCSIQDIRDMDNFAISEYEEELVQAEVENE